MNRRTDYLAHAVALIVMTIWGSTFVFTKLLLLSGLSAANIFTLRFLMAYVMLLGYSLLSGKHRWLAGSLRDELMMLALGVTGGSLYFLSENEAMNHTTTTNTSLIVCTCPLFAAMLLGLFYRSERMNMTQTLGSLLAVAGVATVVLNGHFVLHLSPLGDALAFCACLCWAVYSLLMHRANKLYGTLFITRKVFFYGLLSILPYYLATRDIPSPSILMRTDIILNLLFLGCIASCVCFLTWTWVMKRLGAMTATNYVYFNPVVTIISAWLVLSETITIYFLLGTALILTGMYFADKKRERS